MSGFGSVGRQEWMDDAKCLELSVDEADVLFYPPDPNNNYPAKRFCNGRRNTHGAVIEEPCPVRAECLEFALGRQDWSGVWGGKSPRERQAEARKRAAAEAG